MVNKCVRGSLGRFFLKSFLSLEVTLSLGVRTLILESRNDCHMYAENM